MAGNASPTWGQQQNAWSHGQYQPSPQSWTMPMNPNPNPPWSAPAGPTPNWPSSPGNWGDAAEPMTPGFYGAQNHNSPRWEEGNGNIIRSHSQNIPKRRRSGSRGRSHSFSGGSPWHATSPLWSAGGRGNDTFDHNNLARRPRDWRAGYAPRQGIMGLIYGRGRSDVRGIHTDLLLL